MNGQGVKDYPEVPQKWRSTLSMPDSWSMYMQTDYNQGITIMYTSMHKLSLKQTCSSTCLLTKVCSPTAIFSITDSLWWQTMMASTLVGHLHHHTCTSTYQCLDLETMELYKKKRKHGWHRQETKSTEQKAPLLELLASTTIARGVTSGATM